MGVSPLKHQVLCSSLLRGIEVLPHRIRGEWGGSPAVDRYDSLDLFAAVYQVLDLRLHCNGHLFQELGDCGRKIELIDVSERMLDKDHSTTCGEAPMY